MDRNVEVMKNMLSHGGKDHGSERVTPERTPEMAPRFVEAAVAAAGNGPKGPGPESPDITRPQYGFLDIMAKYLDTESLGMEDLNAISDGTDGKMFFEPVNEGGKIKMVPGIEADGGHTWPLGDGDHVGEGVLDVFAKHIKLGDRDKVNREIRDLMGYGMGLTMGDFLKTTLKSVIAFEDENGIDHKTPLADVLKDENVGILSVGERWESYFAEKDLDKEPVYEPFDITDPDKEAEDAHKALNHERRLSSKANRALDEYLDAEKKRLSLQREFDGIVDSFKQAGFNADTASRMAKDEATRTGLMDRLQEACENEALAEQRYNEARQALDNATRQRKEQVSELSQAADYEKDTTGQISDTTQQNLNKTAQQAEENEKTLSDVAKKEIEAQKLKQARDKIEKGESQMKQSASNIGRQGFSAAKAMADPNGNGGLAVIEAGAMAIGAGISGVMGAVSAGKGLKNANKAESNIKKLREAPKNTPTIDPAQEQDSPEM